MAKIDAKPTMNYTQIFEDLEKFLEFCRNFGYVYNEAHLYNNKNHIFRQFTKYLNNKDVKDNWELDAKN